VIREFADEEGQDPEAAKLRVQESIQKEKRAQFVIYIHLQGLVEKTIFSGKTDSW
jgi:hypothetical protein